MIKWTGLFALSTVLKRKVKFPREMLGGYDIIPNLYLIFVAEPGVVRKSTTIGFAQNLLNELSSLITGEEIRFAGDVTSYSKILDALAESPDSSVAIVSSEFSSLIRATPEATYEILTDIFDNRPNIKWNTWSHGDVLIEKPTVTLFGATTPAWVSRQPPEYFSGGGFASRVLFVFEHERRMDEIYYDHLDWKKLKVLKGKLVRDLNIIANVRGDFTHDTPATKEYIRAWYKQNSKQKPDDQRLTGFHERKHVHGHKVAMLLSLCERSDKKITRKHWDEAIKLLDSLESKYPRAITSMGSNPMGPQMNAILDYLEQRGEAKFSKIAARFYQDIRDLEQLKSILQFLCVAKKIKAKGSDRDPVYEFTD